MKVRILADIVATGGMIRHGEACEVPESLGADMIRLGWAESIDDDMEDVTMYRPRLAVQTPAEHATALRQRRGYGAH